MATRKPTTAQVSFEPMCSGGCPGDFLERTGGIHMPGCDQADPLPPVFESATAPIEDFTCSVCREDVPVTFTDEDVPSGLHRKVRCAAGHVTNGMPVARYRLGGR